MKTLEQLREAVENKSARILSTGLANDLKGSRIATIYFGHRGQDGINEFVVGDVVSHFELAQRDTAFNSIDPRYANRAEYWESYMTPTQLATMKNKLMLLTADGVETQINCYENEGAFWCSDSDRFIYFIEVDPQVIFIDSQYNNGNFAVVSESEFLNRFKFNPGTEVLFEGPKCDVDMWVENYCILNGIELRRK